MARWYYQVVPLVPWYHYGTQVHVYSGGTMVLSIAIPWYTCVLEYHLVRSHHACYAMVCHTKMVRFLDDVLVRTYVHVYHGTRVLGYVHVYKVVT
jgi:hypothetical protein